MNENKICSIYDYFYDHPIMLLSFCAAGSILAFGFIIDKKYNI